MAELESGSGYNAATGEYGDLIAAGVIDPVKVTRSALANAASIASLLLTTETLVVEKPEEEDEHAGSRALAQPLSAQPLSNAPTRTGCPVRFGGPGTLSAFRPVDFPTCPHSDLSAFRPVRIPARPHSGIHGGTGAGQHR